MITPQKEGWKRGRMVFKRYIKRDGKKFGPYYYESYRDKNGTVRKKYLGQSIDDKKVHGKTDNLITPQKKSSNYFNLKDNKTLLFTCLGILGILAIVLIIGLTGFFSHRGFTGFVVDENGETHYGNVENESVVQSFNTTGTDLAIKEPVKFEGQAVSENKNKRMDFDTPNGQIRLYFDLMNYSEFVENAAEATNSSVKLINLTVEENITKEINFTLNITTNITANLSENITTNITTNITANESLNNTNFTVPLVNESNATEVIINETIGNETQNQTNEQTQTSENQTNEQVPSGEQSTEVTGETGGVAGGTGIASGGTGQEGQSPESKPTPVENIPSVNLIRVLGKFLMQIFSPIGKLSGNVIGIDNNESSAVTSLNESGTKEVREVVSEINISEVKDNIENLSSDALNNIADNSVIPAENFDINVNKSQSDLNSSATKYKWGYKVKLKDLKFMAKIDVTSNISISQYDSYTLRIGDNLLSFKDLVDRGYNVTIELPALNIPMNISVSAVNETIINNENVLNKTGNESNGGGNFSEEINQTQKSQTNDNSSQTAEENNTNNSSNIASSEASASEGQGITGNIVKSFIGMVAAPLSSDSSNVDAVVPDIEYKNSISVYIERDFSNYRNDTNINNINNESCYGNETQILTESGWKYFNELDNNDKVMTLNNKTGEKEWQMPTAWQEFDNLNNDMYKIKLDDGSELVVSKEHKVYASLDISNLSSYKVINLPLKSSGLISLSNLENDSNNDSGLFCGILNQTTENIFSFGNFDESVKCLSFDMSTLCSNLENSASAPLESSFGLNITSSPFCFRNFNNSFFIFSSNKNFILCGNQSELSLGELSSKLQSCFNMLFFEGDEKIVQNFFNRSSSFKQFEDLPDHYSGSLKCRSTSTNLSICNNILINFSSHGIDNIKEDLNNYRLQKITDVYEDIKSGKEVYFLNSRNEPVKVESIEKVPYNGKIYDVDVPNDIVLVRRNSETTKASQIINSQTSDLDINEDNKVSSLSDDNEGQGIWSGNSNNFANHNISEAGMTGNAVAGDTDISNVNNKNGKSSESEVIYNLTAGVDFKDMDGDGQISVGDIVYLDPTLTILQGSAPGQVFESGDLLTNVTIENNFSHLTIDDTLVPYNSLVAYYPFDVQENVTNNITYDYSKNNNDGTLTNGVAFNTSCGLGYGNCYNFDGVNDYITLGTTPFSGTGNTNFSFSIWINLASTNYNSNGILTKTNGGSENAGSFSFRYGSTTYALTVWNSTGSSASVATTTGNVGEWHNYIGTVNDTAITLYKDGVAVTPVSFTGGMNLSSRTLLIGALAIGNYCWNGSIDEVMLFNTSLTAQQVSNIYNNQSARFKNPGTQTLKQVNISSGYNQVGVSLDGYNRFLGSNISTRIGAWDISLGYNNTDLNSSANGLVSYWHLDTSTNNNLVAGKVGNATSFDGVGNYISSSALNSRVFINNVSAVSFWFKTNSSATQVIIGGIKWQNGAYSDTLAGSVELYQGHITEGLNSTTGGIGTSGTYFDGVWHNCVVIMNSTNSSDFLFYVDGVLQSNKVEAGYFSNSITIGNIDDYGYFAYFNGSIDELRVWNRSLSDSEILNIYNNESTGVYDPNMNRTGLVLEQHLDNSSGGLYSDTSGAGNNGFAYNFNITTPDAMGLNDGTSQGQSFGNGVYYKGGVFDGVGNYVNATNSSAVISHCLWQKNSTASSWTFVAYDGSSFFTNGVSGLTAQYPINISGNQIKIGVNYTGSQYFNGSIDEVMIFNRSLTSDEVKELYVKGRANWNYSAWQNLTEINSTTPSSTNIFNIATVTTNLLPDFLLLAGNSTNPFISPNLRTTLGLNLISTNLGQFSINVTYPLNITYTTNISTLNFTVTDLLNGNSCWYGNGTLNSTPVSVSNLGSSFNYNFANVLSNEGSNTFTVYCNDTANNINSNSTTFTREWLSTNVTMCRTLDQANTVYTLQNNVSSTGTCINIINTNVTFDGNGFKINYSTGAILGYGVYGNGYNNITIKNASIYEGITTTSNKYAIDLIGSNYSTINNNNIVTIGSGGRGISLAQSSNSTVSSNIISTTGGSGFGIYLGTGSNNDTINSNNISTTSSTTAYGINLVSVLNSNITSNTILTNGTNGYGIYLITGSNLSTITSNTISTNGTTAYGIYLTTASNSNILSLNTINVSKADRIRLLTATTINNTFTNNSIINRNYSYYDINFFTASINGTWLIDQYLENYSFTGAGGTINVKNSNYGQINFISAVNKTGTNFSNDIQILNNSVYVNSAQTGLNKTANVTLYNLPTYNAGTGYINSTLLSVCNSTTSPACINLTSLDTGTQRSFNVSAWDGSPFGIYGTLSDTSYPQFSPYWDNNASITSGGVALFNVTVANTNGTVWLSINGTNYTAGNLTANMYNVSVSGLLNGTYAYNWSAYGNGASHLFNISDTRSYSVNASDTTAPVVNITYPINGITYNVNVSAINYTATDNVGLGSCWYSNSSGVWNSTTQIPGTNWTGVISKEGSNTFTVYCNDTSNNINSSSVTFTVNLDNSYPQFTNNLTSITNGSQYNPGNDYYFNITIANTNGSAGIEFNNVNYSLSNITSSFYKDTGNLGVGTYSYYYWSYGNGTNHYFNNSQTWSYSVVQNSSYNVSITGTTPIIYGASAGISNSSCPSQITCNLYRNDTSGAITSPDSSVLGAGYYNYTFNSSGNANYSAKSASFILEVDKANSQTSLTFDKTSSQNYGNAITPTCSLITGVGSVSLTNGTSNVPETLGAGTWNFNCSYAGNANYTGSSNSSNFVINKATPSLSLTATTPITYGASTDFATHESGCPSQLSPCNLNITDGVFGAGTISANYSTPGNENYTSASSVFTVTINKANSNCQVQFNTTTPQTYPYNFLVWSDCNSAFNLYRNGTSIDNNSVQPLGAGIYNFTVIRADNQNYTNVGEEQDFQIYQGTLIITKLLNGGTSNITIIYPQQVNATGSSTAGIIKIYRDGVDKTTENGLNVSLSAGLYIYKFNVTGNENYSNIAGEYMQVNISKATPSLTFLANSGTSNLTLTYPQQVNISASANHGIVGLDKNGLDYLPNNHANVTLGAGSYIFRANVTGNANYSDVGYSYYNVTITPKSSVTTLTINPADSIIYPDVSNFSCSNSEGKTTTLYINGIASSEMNQNIVRAAGDYAVSCNFSGNQNYSASSDQKPYTINQLNPSSLLSISILPSDSVSQGTQTTATGLGCPSQISCNFYRNGTGITSPDTKTLSKGTYTYVYNTTGNENYSSGTTNAFLTVGNPPDTTAPITTLLSPLDGTNTTDGSQVFNASFNENVNLKNSTFYLWNSANSVINHTIFVVSGETNESSISISLSDYDVYYWNYYTCDNSSNCNWSVSNYSINYSQAPDTVYPQFSLYSDNSNNFTNSGTGIFNVTVANTNGTVWLEINNTNITATNLSSSVYNVSYSFSSGGTYNYKWWSYGNGRSHLINNSVTRSYAVLSDTIAPNVSLTSPDNGSNVYSRTVYFAANFTDDNALKNASVYVWNSTGSLINSSQNSAITGLLNSTNLSVILPYDDSFKWNYYACDNYGNCGFNTTANRTVNVYTGTPQISYASDTLNDSSRVWQSNIYVNVSVPTSYVKNITFKLYYSNNTPINNTTYNLTTGIVYSINWTGLSGNDYKYNVSVYDLAGNYNKTATRTITLIASQENVSLNSGWNLMALTFNNNTSGGVGGLGAKGVGIMSSDTSDRNVSIVVGWNLIGYSSDSALAIENSKFTNSSGSQFTWDDAVANGKLNGYATYYDSSSPQPGEREYKYAAAADLGMDSTNFTGNKGYWIYANEAGTLTLSGSGGAASGQTYKANKLRFSNGTSELNATAAISAGWVSKIADGSSGNIYTTIDLSKSFDSFNSWNGYFIWSNKDNITLIRQN